jgi:UDP-N-acetylmuramoylalanine--D-glutamate ligase
VDAQVTLSGPVKGVAVCVAGIGVSGVPTARVLASHGAVVTAVDARDDEEYRRRAAELTALGVTVRLGDGETLPAGTELLVTTGWRPDAPLLAAAAAAGVEIVGEVELAWRMRGPGAPPWLAITGTDGKTTVVRMLVSILRAAGLATIAVGNVGTSIIEAVAGAGAPGYDVLAVELSSFQLHWSSSVIPYAATVLNLAPDHLDWHGSLEAYAADKGKIFAPGTIIVVNADDPWSVRLGESARSAAAGYVTFSSTTPAAGALGVVEDLLVDRAFVPRPRDEAAELADFGDVKPFAPHNVANALAAAALARAYGVPAEAVRAGLRAYVPDPHRIQHIATVGGVDYVNDSKATNPHAAAASLAAFPSIVWIAGGLLKGADVDDLVAACAPRLRGAVLIGTDRGRISDALARHAPNVPVMDVSDTDTGAMDRVVTEAASLARPGDTVLLAPVGASMDMFANYPARGDAFAAAVRRLAAPELS